MKRKIVRTFVREEAYHTLREWIVNGKLIPGVKLRDKELAIKMGVSRTPIREALLKLEDEGLVKSKPNSATCVSPIDIDDAYHLYSIVSALEKLALREAFPNIKSEHLSKLEKANQLLKDALKRKDAHGAIKADHDFHTIYVDLANNTELDRILENLKTKLKRIDLYYFEEVKNADHSLDEHREIIKALKNNNLTAAIKAVETNWHKSYRRMKGEKDV